MLIPVEVDQACHKTLLQPPRAPWCRSLWKGITTSGFQPPSWNFWMKEESGEFGIYISDKLAPKNIGVATEIVSISISVVKLLVLPLWGTVSTSVLYLILFSKVGYCRNLWKWIGRALKHCCSRWEYLDVVFCRKVIITSGIRPPSWKFWM